MKEFLCEKHTVLKSFSLIREMYKLFCLPEHDDGDSIVHDTLSKDKRIEIMVHVQVMKYGQYCHCG